MRKFLVLFYILSAIFITACAKEAPISAENTPRLPEQTSSVVETAPAAVEPPGVIPSISETDFVNAVNSAGYLDRSTFSDRYSETDKDMLSKMDSDNVFGVFYESRPFNINELDGLEQYRFFNISEPSDWDSGKYLWETGDFAAYFAFSGDEYSKKFVENFVNDIKLFSPDTDIERTSTGDDNEKYVSTEASASGAVVMTHCIYRLDNSVIYIECLAKNHAAAILDSLEK